MTALVIGQRPPLQSPLRWSWPRVGALSGALSLHFVAIVLLLVPPVAMTVLRPVKDDTTWVDLIKSPPPMEEPALPQPKPLVHEVRPKPQPRRAEAPAPAPVAESQMQAPAAVPAPAPADAPPQASLDVAPVALAYHTRTRVPYPHDALQARQQGTVILRVLVGVDGQAQAVEVERSSGSRSLDNAARDAVRKWTFQSGTRDGIPVPLWARVPVSFTLQSL